MRVHVVSDVHGATEALTHAADGADALICLGDLLLFVDYDDHSKGIFADLFGVEAANRLVELRLAKRFAEAKEFTDSLWDGLLESRAEAFQAAVRRQYATTFAAMPTPAYLTYGNVDVPPLWPEFLREGMHLLDGERVEIGGPGVRVRRGAACARRTEPRTRSVTRTMRPRSQLSGPSTCCAATSRRRCPSCCTTCGPGASSGAARRC